MKQKEASCVCVATCEWERQLCVLCRLSKGRREEERKRKERERKEGSLGILHPLFLSFLLLLLFFLLPF